MSGVIIDYSTSRPSIAQLKSAGVSAVIRYIGWDSVSGFSSIGKNITKGESAVLLANGIDVGLCFEYNANAPAQGSAQGHKDGVLATEQVFSELGAPEGVCVYFAVDFDAPDYAPGLPDIVANAMAKLGPIGEYFSAIRALNPKYAVGAYGGYWVIKRLFDAGLIHYGWQTKAWSGSNVDSRISLLQMIGGSPIAGADVDVREHNGVAPWGSWLQAKAAVPAPTPPPVPAPTGPTLAEAQAAWTQWQKLSVQADAQMAIVQKYLNAQK